MLNEIFLHNLFADHALDLLIADKLILLPVHLQTVLLSVPPVTERLLAEDRILDEETVHVPVLDSLVILQDLRQGKPLVTRLARELELLLGDVPEQVVLVVLVYSLLMILQISFCFECSVAKRALMAS